jgi:hypothetical protein
MAFYIQFKILFCRLLSIFWYAETDQHVLAKNIDKRCQLIKIS